MNKSLLISLIVIGLAACAPKERTGAPAPIITPGKPAPGPVQGESKPPARPSPPAVAYPLPPAPSPTAPPGTVAPEKPSPADTEPAPKSPAAPVSQGTTPTRPTEVSFTSPPAAPAPPLLPMPQNLSPPVAALIEQAEQKRRDKNYVGAVAALERAVGIQPLEPYIWNRLARIRMEKGDYAQAKQLAERSNDLTRGQATRAALQRDNKAIIAVAKGAVGKTTGA